jgi:hypothetical protein
MTNTMVDTVYSSNLSIVKQLETFEGVSRLNMSRGQVLLYREHQPAGIFILLSGSASLACDDRGCVHLERAAGGPVTLPAFEDLERPSQVTITVLEAAELLHIPRSLVLSTSTVRELLVDDALRAPQAPWKGPQR